MRFMRIGSVYPACWRQFYARRPELQNKPYAEQLASFFYDSFSQSDSYSHYLRALGYECEEVIANIEPLQKQWAKENGVPWNVETFVGQHPLEMARRFRPEIVFLNDFSTFGTKWVEELRSICRSVRLVVGWCAIGVNDLTPLRGYDIVLTSSMTLLRAYRDAGLNAEFLRHAFDPRVLDRTKPPSARDIPVSFAGGIGRMPGFHDYRAAVIERVLQSHPVALYCSEGGKLWRTAARRAVFEVANVLRLLGMPQGSLAKLPFVGRCPTKPLFRWEDPIQRASRGAVYGLDMYRVLGRSRITLNAHITASGTSTGNIRLFEATGMGACLVTDWKDDLKDLFELDREVVAYRNPNECVEKVRWLLDNPERCQEIAVAGQRKTLRDHTYAERAIQLNDLFLRHCHSS